MTTKSERAEIAIQNGLDCSDLTHEQVQRILKWSAQSNREVVKAKLSELLEKLPEANPKEWADNLPQVAWTVGFDKALTEVRTVIEEMMEQP